MNVDVGHGGRGPVDVRTKVILEPWKQAISMVARASSGRRRGPRSEHDPLEVSVETNGDHRERCRKQLQGVFRHKGGDFPAWRISTRKLVQHGRERDRGPRRPWGIAVSTVLPSKSSIAPAAEVVARASSRCTSKAGSLAVGPGGRKLEVHGGWRSRWSRRPRRPWACPACPACPWPWRPVPVKLERPLRPGLARGLAPCRTGIIDSSKWCLSCQTHSVAAGKLDVSMA